MKQRYSHQQDRKIRNAGDIVEEDIRKVAGFDDIALEEAEYPERGYVIQSLGVGLGDKNKTKGLGNDNNHISLEMKTTKKRTYSFLFIVYI